MQPLSAEDPPRLGSFELIGRLGEGGQGIVYLGRGPEGEQVAVKLLHHGLIGDPEARARFLREVSVAQRVARFCTAPVLHADLAGSRPYIVSEYVPGPSLRQLVDRQGPRRGASLERLAVSTATALSAIHRAGILHRDFKPANVLMGPEGPVVIDFGIARALDSPGMTATGVAMGTPSYLAPEQLGSGEVTPAADVFAWGVTMVFAATGTPAFGQDSIAIVINRILNAEPELGALEGGLRELVAACLSKDPALRPTAEQLVSHLMGTAPTPAGPVPTGPRPAPAADPGPGPPPAAAMRQNVPPANGPGPGAPEQGPGPHGPGTARPQHTTTLRSGPEPVREPGERKARRPLGLLLTGVAVVATLGVATGTAVILQNDEKTTVAQTGTAPAPAGISTSDPAPAPVDPPAAWENSSVPVKTGKGTEADSASTPHPPRRTTLPTSRPAEDPNRGASGVTPPRASSPAAPTAKPTPPANSEDSVQPSDVVGPSSASEPTSKPTTAKPTVKPTAKPTATAKPAAKPSPKPVAQTPNPYTATGVCGSGYKVVNSRALGKVATIYLLYNSAAGKNCVITMSRYVIPAKISMNATLQVKGGSTGSNPGKFTVYAGPVRLSAAGKCVIWGGSHGSLSWKSGWSHCG